MFKKFLAVTVVVSSMMLTGCIKPPDFPGVVSISTNEIAFLVDLTSDKTATGSLQTAVQRKDIPIQGYWVRQGRWEHQGYWRPASRVIVVSQAPARVVWDQNSQNTVRMVSRESSGFILPVIVNAYIASVEDAQLYLSAFRPVVKEEIDWSRINQRQWGEFAKERAQPLETALNTVVFARLQEQLSQLFVKTPIQYCEVLSKIFIPAVFEGVTKEALQAQVASAIPELRDVRFEADVPSLRDWSLQNYGVTISVLAAGDGIIFDDENVQKQIDALAAAIMQNRVLIQEQSNAREQQRVETINAETARQVALAQSATISTRASLQRIENEKAIAEATARAIESGKVVPAGSYPTGLNSLIITPNYNSLGQGR